MARSTNINTSEFPKIVIKNVDAVNWSYSDVFNSLDDFINEMKKLGNKKWNEMKADDIIDYRVHIPYNVIPKDLLETQTRTRTGKQSKQ